MNIDRLIVTSLVFVQCSDVERDYLRVTIINEYEF